MEYTEGGFRYENIRSNAYWHNVHLDTRFRPHNDVMEDTIRHYNDCKQHPTVALLARKKSETNNYPDFKIRNEHIMKKNLGVKAAKDSFEKAYNELYPKTKNARKYLIDKEFVTLDYVKPRVKTFGKMLFKLFGR